MYCLSLHDQYAHENKLNENKTKGAVEPLKGYHAVRFVAGGAVNMENRNSTLVSEQNKFRLRPSENTPEIQQPDLSKTCTVGPPSPTHTREKKRKTRPLEVKCYK